MADNDLGTGTPPAGDSGTPPAGNPPTPPAGEGNKPKTVEELQAELDAVRAGKTSSDNEAKNLRARLKALEDAEAKRKEAELSDVEKANKQLAEATAKAESLKGRLVEFAVRSVATELGAIDAEVVAKLVDRSKLELDDDGSPKNAKSLIEELFKAKPYLKGDKGVPASAATNGASNPPAGSEAEKVKQAVETFSFLQSRVPAAK